MNKMAKELEYYKLGQNESDDNIIQMWIQHCLNLDEMNYIFVGALRNNRLEPFFSKLIIFQAFPG